MLEINFVLLFSKNYLIKIKRIGNFKDEFFNKSFLENNPLLKFNILNIDFFSVLRLIKLVENKNKVSSKKFVFNFSVFHKSHRALSIN